MPAACDQCPNLIGVDWIGANLCCVNAAGDCFPITVDMIGGVMEQVVVDPFVCQWSTVLGGTGQGVNPAIFLNGAPIVDWFGGVPPGIEYFVQVACASAGGTCNLPARWTLHCGFAVLGTALCVGLNNIRIEWHAPPLGSPACANNSNQQWVPQFTDPNPPLCPPNTNPGVLGCNDPPTALCYNDVGVIVLS